MTAQHFVRYDVDDRVAVITLDRPEAANAQTPGVLKDLDDAWRRADEAPDVRVIVFQTTGKHFSAGHDMSGNDPSADGRNLRPQRTDGKLLADTYYDWETRGYLEYAKRWRDIPKPSIAAVQGKCIAAGLMLCWPCDLIVAADNAQFSDPVGMLGIMGVEYHAHTWELGPRKAKEMLFTQSSVSADEALRCGMVNHVVPLDDLRSFTMDLAHRVAQTDPWALRLAKRAVNQTMDTMGFSTAIASCFDMHHLGHTRALAATGGQTVVMADLERMKAAGRGKILNIGSMYSVFGAPLVAAYAASKGGVVQLTRSLAAAWAPDNIQVNVILPGWINTDLTKSAREQIQGLDAVVVSRTPAGRWGEPDDLAGAAVFLCSPASDYVTGVSLPVDGGYSARG